MSRTPTIPIETALNNIMQAKQGGDVRDSIHDAIASCYNDVSSPELNTEALEAALQTKIDEGEMAALTIGDGTITGAKLANGTIPKAKLDPSITFDDSTIKRVIGNDIISASSAFDNITWATGYFHPTTGEVTGNSEYRYAEEYFNTTILQFVKKCALQTRNIACVVFYDGDKEIVGVINTTSNGGALVVTSIPVPQDAVYFRLCQIATNINPLPITFYTLEELFAKSETDLPVDIQSVLTSQGGINVDGNLSTYNDWKVTDYIKVAPGMLLKYSGCGNIGGNATLCPIAFYDSDKNPILTIRPTNSDVVSIYNKGWLNDSDTGPSLNFGFVFAPPAARYCRLSGYRQLAPTLTVATIEPWAGKKCAFFGDSITYGIGTVEKYCNFLAMLRGITVANYAVNGSILVTNGMDRVTAFVTDYADKGVDAFIFAYGTNDWGNNKPLGEWYTTDSNGARTLSTDTTTFRGAWVQILTYLKTNFDGKKIILMTPIHRGAGSYASDLTRNTIGLYLEDYVKVIKEAGEIFSVDVIDLYGESGINPNINPSTIYFTPNDRLHPNVEGHRRIANVISSRLNVITAN